MDPLWELCKEIAIERLDHHGHKLRHLKERHVLSPPQILLTFLRILSKDQRQQIICVHQDVDKGIQGTSIIRYIQTSHQLTLSQPYCHRLEQHMPETT